MRETPRLLSDKDWAVLADTLERGEALELCRMTSDGWYTITASVQRLASRQAELWEQDFIIQISKVYSDGYRLTKNCRNVFEAKEAADG